MRHSFTSAMCGSCCAGARIMHDRTTLSFIDRCLDVLMCSRESFMCAIFRSDVQLSLLVGVRVFPHVASWGKDNRSKEQNLPLKKLPLTPASGTARPACAMRTPVQLLLLQAVVCAGAPPADMKPVSFSSKLQARRAALDWYCIENSAVRCHPASARLQNGCCQRRFTRAAASQPQCVIGFPNQGGACRQALPATSCHGPLAAPVLTPALSLRATVAAYSQEHKGEVPCLNHQYTLQMAQVRLAEYRLRWPELLPLPRPCNSPGDGR
jgi:hypothetical protein